MSNPNVVLKISALDDTRQAFEAIKQRLGGLNEAAGTMREKIEQLQPTFERMAAAGTAAFAAVSAFSFASIRGAAEAEVAQKRLAHVIQTSTGASDAQVAALIRQAEALEQVGVVSADAINILQEEAASFDLSAAAIERLTPAAADFAVALYGINPSAEQARQAMTGLGKALQGQLELLTKKGYRLNENSEAILKNGTEEQRVAEIINILSSNYENLNVAMRNTTEGGIVGMTFAAGKLSDTIGESLIPVFQDVTASIMPVLARITEWISKNPELTRNIVLATGAIAGLVAVVGTIGIVLGVLLSPMSLVAAAVTAVGVAAAVVATRWRELPLALQLVLLPIKVVIEWLRMTYETLVTVGNGISFLFGKVQSVMGVASAATKGSVNDLQGTIDKFIDPLAGQSTQIGNFSTAITGLGETASETADKLKRLKEEATKIFSDVKLDEARSKEELAEAIVAQEESIAEKKRELRELERSEDSDSNATRIRELQSTIKEEENALRAVRDIRLELRAEIDEAERRASLTAFERQVEDIQRERVARLQAQLARLQEIQAEVAAEQSKNNAIASSFTGAQSKMQSAIAKTREVAEAEAERIKKAFDRAISSMNQLSGDGRSLQSRLPGRASGGPVMNGQPYVVGERGPEVFVPSGAGRIIPNYALAGGSSAPVFNLTITGNSFMGEDDMAERVGDRLIGILKQNMRL